MERGAFWGYGRINLIFQRERTCHGYSMEQHASTMHLAPDSNGGDLEPAVWEYKSFVGDEESQEV